MAGATVGPALPGSCHGGKVVASPASRPPSLPLEKYLCSENRFKLLAQSDAESANEMLALTPAGVATRWRLYENWAAMKMPGGAEAKPQTTAEHSH